MSKLILFLFISLCCSLELQTTKKCVEQALNPTDTNCFYPKSTSSQALTNIRSKWIVFMGESTLRQMYLQLLGLIEEREYFHIKDRKDQIEIEERRSSSRYTFYYYPFYNNLTEHLSAPPQLYDGQYPDLLVLNDGMHDLLYNYDLMQKDFTKLTATIRSFSQKYSIPILWISPSQLHDNFLTKHRKASQTFRNQSLYEKANLPQKQFIKSLEGDSLFLNIFKNVKFEITTTFDGIHSMEIARKQSEAFVGACFFLANDENFWQKDKITVGQLMCLLIYISIFLGTILCEILQYFYYKPLIHNSNMIISIEEKESLLSDSQSKQPLQPLTNEKSLRLPGSLSFLFNLVDYYIQHLHVFRAAFLFCQTMMIVYLMDGPRHHFVIPKLKRYNRDFFIFLHLVILLFAYLTTRQNKGKDQNQILSRLQTEEWKGIMQIIFVMYHYFDAAEVYNLIRVFIGAYVMLTGWGNTMFFINKKIFNTTRILGMLLRLNWLVFWTCLVLDQRLILYYICPLHTFFFLLTYVTWALFYTYNDRISVQVTKLIVCFIFLYIVFDVFDAQQFDHFWYFSKWLFSYNDTLYEWRFRTTLDHYATWLGMCFGCAFAYITERLAQVESLPRKRELAVKWAVSIVCVCLVVFWLRVFYVREKHAYNAIHPYWSWIPIFSYIALRNMSKRWRIYYSSVLSWLGSITLETYIFQYHLYMIDDAKSLLTIIDGYPLVNFLLVSAIYITLSKVAFQSTNTFRNYFYPVKKDASNKDVLLQTAKYAMWIILLYAVCFVIHSYLLK